jgi:hypothetical protein
VIIEECAFTSEGSERFGKLLESSKRHEICRGENDRNGAVVNVGVEKSDYGPSICALPFLFHGMFLVSTTGRIRLYKLHTDIMSHLHLPILAHYLPSALYVEKLHFNMYTESTSGSWSADDEER